MAKRDWTKLDDSWNTNRKVKRVLRKYGPTAGAYWALIIARAHRESHHKDNPTGAINCTLQDLADELHDHHNRSSMWQDMVEANLVTIDGDGWKTDPEAYVTIQLGDTSWVTPKGSPSERTQRFRDKLAAEVGDGPYLYFARSEGDSTLVKIGWSKDPVRRVEALVDPVLKCRARLAGVVPAQESYAKRVRRSYAASCVQGEWFRATPDLERFISDVSKPLACDGVTVSCDGVTASCDGVTQTETKTKTKTFPSPQPPADDKPTTTTTAPKQVIAMKTAELNEWRGTIRSELARFVADDQLDFTVDRVWWKAKSLRYPADQWVWACRLTAEAIERGTEVSDVLAYIGRVVPGAGPPVGVRAGVVGSGRPEVVARSARLAELEELERRYSGGGAA